MNKYKKLLNNSFIFAVGNLGSKIIGILMVPLYTFYFTPADYGNLDLVTTTVSLIVPIFTLSIFEATFRFVMDKNESPTNILTNSLLITVFGLLVLLLFFPFFKNQPIFVDNYVYIYLLINFQAIQVLFSQFVRGINKIKLFAVNGIIMAVSLATLNIVFIVYLKMGLSGYLLSLVLSNLFSVIIFIIFGKLWMYFNFKTINKNLMMKLLLYSIPLVPNTFIWWMANVSNRYFIVYFIGASANGLFAVANKIPTLLTMVNSIFTQAWQISAVEEYENKKNDFYSETFNVLAYVLFFSSSVIIFVLKPVFSFAIASDFFDSWKYVPILLLGVIYSSFSNFYGVNYLAAKKTTGVLKTTIIGGIINVILNLLLIPLFHLQGAGIATAMSFFIIWILRIKDSKDIIQININKKTMLSMNILFLIQCLFLFLNKGLLFESCINIIVFLLYIYIGKNYFSVIIKNVGVKFGKTKN